MEIYHTLDLNPWNTKQEVKKKYRELALLYHPDRNNGDDVRFKQVQKAYQLISQIEPSNCVMFKADLSPCQNNQILIPINSVHFCKSHFQIIKDRWSKSNRYKGLLTYNSGLWSSKEQVEFSIGDRVTYFTKTIGYITSVEPVINVLQLQSISTNTYKVYTL